MKSYFFEETSSDAEATWQTWTTLHRRQSTDSLVSASDLMDDDDDDCDANNDFVVWPQKWEAMQRALARQASR